MNTQTKAALERVRAVMDEERVAQLGALRPAAALRLLSADGEHTLHEDLEQLIEALTSPIGELFQYSEWLDGQSIITGDVPLTDDNGNETGEVDDRSHEQLVKDYLAEADCE